MRVFKLTPLALVAMSFHAHALHYCKCDAGAHPSCVAGSDSNDGSTAALARVTLPDSAALEGAAAGTTHNLCAGGSWVDSSVPNWLIQNMNVTRTAPLTIQTYAPASGATGQARLQSSSGSAFQWTFGGFNNPTAHGGYVLRNLIITRSGSPASGSEGVVFYGTTQYVTLENVQVTNWSNGVHATTTQNITNLTIRNSDLSGNCQNGITGNATDLLVEDTTISDNNAEADGCGAFLLQHGAYMGGVDVQIRSVWRRNTFANNSLTTGGICGSGNATFRGNVDQFVFEENTIFSPGGNSQCIGLSIQDGYGSDAECMRNVVARGNKIVDTGSSAILARITPGALFENNEAYAFNTTTAMTGINVANPGSAQDQILCSAGSTTVRNNSAYYASGTSGQAVSVNAGSGHSVFNNLAVVASGSSANCWAHAGATFTLWNNNWCYEQGSGQWSATYSTLAAAQAAGFDANGGNADPLLAATPNSSSYSMALQSGSPLRSAGRNTGKAPRDLLWCQRDDTPDIGAHEHGASTCLTFRAPVELR
jgi:hypothetical protein